MSEQQAQAGLGAINHPPPRATGPHPRGGSGGRRMGASPGTQIPSTTSHSSGWPAAQKSNDGEAQATEIPGNHNQAGREGVGAALAPRSPAQESGKSRPQAEPTATTSPAPGRSCLLAPRASAGCPGAFCLGCPLQHKAEWRLPPQPCAETDVSQASLRHSQADAQAVLCSSPPRFRG